MPIPNTPKPFPNVPPAPGVPAIPRQANAAPSPGVSLALADATNLLNLFIGPQWGLFTQDGTPAFIGVTSIAGLIADVVTAVTGGTIGGQSVGDTEYRREYKISTAPQEQGAFLSYNKVQTPFDGKVTYIISGLAPQRGAFLQQVEAAAASLTLLSLVMPEITYPSCNVVRYGVRRRADSGLTMFMVDITVEEVRITGTTQFTSTGSPSGASQTNTGNVQAVVPTAAEQAAGPAGGLT